VIVGVLAALAWWPMLQLDLHGWDTYPMIAAARVSSLGELLGTFGEELMDGRFPGGRYWRPLVHFSFALDHLLFGLAPFGYHLTDLLLVVAAAGVTTLIARRLFAGRVAAFVAGLAYAWHPVHFEVLPLPARRADALCVLFTLLAVLVQLGERRRPVLVALLALAAMGAKETGVVAPLLVIAFAWAAARAEPEGRTGPRANALALGALALYVAARTLVLGGLGGGARTSFAGAVTELPAVAGRYGPLLAYPEPWLGELAAAALPGLVFALLATWIWLLPRAADTAPSAAPDARRVALVLLGWLLAVAVLTGLTGTLRSWYALAFLAPFALALGLVVDRALAARSALRPLALATVALALAVQWGGRFALGVMDEKRAASSAAAHLVERFTVTVESAQPGETLEIDARPPKGSDLRHGEPTRRPMTLAPYSLQAYADLVMPWKPVRVELSTEEAGRASPDEVLVLLIGRS
jgi:hypothetical protein